MSSWTETTVTKIESRSPNTKSLWLTFPDDYPLEYIAGQFVVLELPIHEKRTKKWRSYSIASAPDGSKSIELCVVKLEGGKGSTYLCDTVQVGDTIKTKKPRGVFTLPENIEDRDLVLVCTGTGIAPFRAMIQSIFKDKPAQSVHLIFGTRYESGILYRTELEALAEAHPNFTYTPCLSREEEWKGAKGYVHEVYTQQYAEITDNRHFYLCGWSTMVDEAVERLEKMGYPKSQVHFELYG